MLRLRAWVFFLFLLLIGALLVATAPSFQACVNQAGPAAASSQPQRHGTTVTAARTTRDCLARFFTEMLARGIYLPPSAFEAWFPSLAHGDEELDRTLAAAAEAFGVVASERVA